MRTEHTRRSRRRARVPALWCPTRRIDLCGPPEELRNVWLPLVLHARTRDGVDGAIEIATDLTRISLVGSDARPARLVLS